jgi:hypothetical protein
MNEHICEVLGLPATGWPPDHYALLGLKRGESDMQLIEQRVHERMRQVRPYQLNYPDQVTEAMNQLAQAFACLTDPIARQAYDKSLQEPGRSHPGFAPRTENGIIDPEDPLAWLFGPWDRLGDPESAGVSHSRPHFRDWAASAPPPLQNKLSQTGGATAAPISPAPMPPTAAQAGMTRCPFFLKYSRVLLTILSFIALLAAAWRQFGR